MGLRPGRTLCAAGHCFRRSRDVAGDQRQTPMQGSCRRVRFGKWRPTSRVVVGFEGGWVVMGVTVACSSRWRLCCSRVGGGYAPDLHAACNPFSMGLSIQTPVGATPSASLCVSACTPASRSPVDCLRHVALCWPSDGRGVNQSPRRHPAVLLSEGFLRFALGKHVTQILSEPVVLRLKGKSVDTAVPRR
jgi:hypothetical protein